MDAFKRETVVDYTSWDLNTKWVNPKNKHKDKQRFKRKARRKNKNFLKIMLDNPDKVWYTLVTVKEREVMSMTRERIVNGAKAFFHIEEPFKLEYNDIRALITVINVVLIMIFGLSIAWFGLAVALIGTIKDLKIDRHINGLVMHLASVALNIYFLILLYK